MSTLATTLNLDRERSINWAEGADGANQQIPDLLFRQGPAAIAAASTTAT